MQYTIAMNRWKQGYQLIAFYSSSLRVGYSTIGIPRCPEKLRSVKLVLPINCLSKASEIVSVIIFYELFEFIASSDRQLNVDYCQLRFMYMDFIATGIINQFKNIYLENFITVYQLDF